MTDFSSRSRSRSQALAAATALPSLADEEGVRACSVTKLALKLPTPLPSRRSQQNKAAPAKKTARSRLQARPAKHGGKGRPSDRQVRDARSPLDWQQAHSPTQSVTLWEPLEGAGKEEVQPRATSGAWRAARRQQRVVDAKLWSRLTPGEQAASERIYGGFAKLARGLGVGGCALAVERVDGGGRPDPDFFQAQVRDYLTWGQRCRRAVLDHGAIMAVLGEGRSCAEADRLCRRRKGYTRDQLGQGLALYCQLKGWNST